MSFKIVTDSGSDLSKEEALEHDITVLPLTTHFGEETCKVGIDMTIDEFYSKLEKCSELPHTAAVTPLQYEEVYDSTDEDILVISLSGALSCTYQNGVIAADGRPNVYCCDSKQATIGQVLLIRRAVELRSEGKSCKEVHEILEREKDDIILIALLDTLLYLKKGGRISGAKAFIGNILKIKPVITLRDGSVDLRDKARGAKNGANLLRKLAESDGIDFNRPYGVAYSGSDDTLVKEYLEGCKDLYENYTIDSLQRVGGIIGTHIGPNAIAVAFFRNNK